MFFYSHNIKTSITQGVPCKITIFTHNSDAPLSHECTTRAFHVHQAHTCQSHNPKSKKTSFEQREKNVSSAYTLITLSFIIQWKHDFFSSPVSLILFLQGWIISAFLLHCWQQKGGCFLTMAKLHFWSFFWGGGGGKEEKGGPLPSYLQCPTFCPYCQ